MPREAGLPTSMARFYTQSMALHLGGLHRWQGLRSLAISREACVSTISPTISAHMGEYMTTQGSLLSDRQLLMRSLLFVVRRYAHPGLLRRLRRMLRLAFRRRDGDSTAQEELEQILDGLDDRLLEEVMRALQILLDLASVIEDRQRVRVLRQRQMTGGGGETLQDAVERLQRDGLDGATISSLLARIRVEPVFTAHPTEAKRRTVREALSRLRGDLAQLDRSDLLTQEEDDLRLRIRQDLACLWETDTLHPKRPTPHQEVRRSLHLLDALWTSVPQLLRRIEAIGGHAVGNMLRFGTWIGGDRDGNPYVTAEVTQGALLSLRNAVLERHIKECRRAASLLSMSRRLHPMGAALERAVLEAEERWGDRLLEALKEKHPDETYRRWLTVIRMRLQASICASMADHPDPAAYTHANELAQDLLLISDSLRANGHRDLADSLLASWQYRLQVFGFHGARLDLREDSRVVLETVAACCRASGFCDNIEALDDDALRDVLCGELPPTIADGAIDGVAGDLLTVFRLRQRAASRFGGECLGCCIVSMTHRAEDILAFAFLERYAAACEGVPHQASPMVPLFETIDDLQRASEILDRLLVQERYREHLKQSGGDQVCMVGYSDSTKDGGYLTANWALFSGQEALAACAARHSVPLTVFHGRGGALGRGGGPAARGILSLPSGAVQGRLRLTEQGEVLAERYDDPAIAARHLEQLIWGTLLVTASDHQRPQQEWRDIMETVSAEAYGCWRELVDDPYFMHWFAECTPISIIENLAIGSRPARRRERRSLADLRAIPFTFAWTQSRQMLTAFYGLGQALSQQVEKHLPLLQEMYGQWPFFRAVIDNAELALAKCDMQLGDDYARLARDAAAGQQLAARVRHEHAQAVAAVLAIKQVPQLLHETPWLAESIAARSPFIDILNLAQMRLMQRAAQQDAPMPLLRLSVQSIAAGMRTTG